MGAWTGLNLAVYEEEVGCYDLVSEPRGFIKGMELLD